MKIKVPDSVLKTIEKAIYEEIKGDLRGDSEIIDYDIIIEDVAFKVALHKTTKVEAK